MSAITRAYVWCDHVDRDAPPGQQTCRARVEDTDGTTPMWTRADARREAKRRGWLVRVHVDGLAGGDHDYCPQHRAAHEPQKEAPDA